MKDGGVPMVDLSHQYEEIKAEADAAVLSVLSGGRFILGPEVSAFEEEFASYLGVGEAVGVGNGTDAIHLVLQALGIGPGDEVITTPYTFVATAEPIAKCGAVPVFADMDPRTYNMDPSAAAARFTGRTKAVIAVHLFGLPAAMDEILALATDRGVPVIEDCAQAHGARHGGRRVGSLGRASTFSFFPTKPLGGAGDGGMVCTDDRELAASVRMLRAHGAKRKYYHEVLGENSRLDEIQAALLRIKLKRLDAWNEDRRALAGLYDGLLEAVETPFVPEGADHVYHQYTVRTPRRDELAEALKARGIGSNIYFPVPLHLQGCFGYLGYAPGSMPQSEKASEEALSLPMHYGLSKDQVRRVCEAVNEALA